MKRKVALNAFTFQNEQARTTKLIHPKGVYRFKTFEDFNIWKDKNVKVVKLDNSKK